MKLHMCHFFIFFFKVLRNMNDILKRLYTINKTNSEFPLIFFSRPSVFHRQRMSKLSVFSRPGSLSPCRLCSLLWHWRILACNHQPCHHKILLWLDNDESSFTMKFTMTKMMVMMLLCPRWNTMWVSATRRTFGSANPTIGCLVGWEFPSSY